MTIRRNQFATTCFLIFAALLNLNPLFAQTSSPSVTAQPQSLTVIQGENANFNVTASGGALSYQWRFETTNISGATASSYTVSNAQPANVGKYSVVVSNSLGNITSSNAALTVNVPPSISEQPQSLIINVGADATFSIAVSGLEPFSYQWRFNGTNISGATGSSFTRFAVQLSDAGNYSVQVTNIAGMAVSENASLMVVTNALYWDINGTNSGSGDTTRPNGSWTNSFWSLSADGNTPTANWTPGATAIFSAGTNATRNYIISLTEDQSVGALGFEDGLVTISGTNALNFTGVADITVTSNREATISALIRGDAGLAKNGSGTLSLEVSNAFTGAVQINGGVLSINQSNALGKGTSPITINGATLRSTETGNKDFVDLVRPIEIGPLDATIEVADGNAILTYDGTISGAGRTLIKTGAGDFRSRSNGFAKLIVDGGTFRVRGGAEETAFGAVPASFVTNGITLNGGAIGTAAAITTPATRGILLTTNSGTFILNQHWAINSVISGPGSLIKDFGSAPSILSLNGANSYSGKTFIKSGIISVTNDNGLGTAPVSNVVDQLTFDGGRLKTSGDFSLNANRGIFLGADGGTVDVTDTLTYNGVISGTGSLLKLGEGTLRLGGTNSYTGSTILTNGTLEIGSNGALGSGLLEIFHGTIQATAASTRTISNFVFIAKGFTIGNSGSLIFAGDIDLGTNTTKVITNNANTLFAGEISNVAGLIKAGSGTLSLSNANSYTGSTKILEGALNIFADQNLSAVPVSASESNIVLRGGTLQASSTFTLNANRGVLLQNDGGAIYVHPTKTLTLPGPITGVGGIAKTGPGILILAGVNNYSGPTIISDGTLLLNSSERIPNTSPVTISSGGILDLNDWTETIGSLSGSGLVRVGNGTLIVGTDNSDTVFSGTFTGIGNIIKVGSGTLTLSDQIVFSGQIIVNGGNVIFGSPLTVNIVGNGSVTPNRNGQYLEIGTAYNITAVPAPNNLFSHWSGGVSSTARELTFVMQSNLVLVANFVPDTILPLVAINFPAADLRTNATSITLQGTASDNLQIATVLYQIGNGSFQTADGTTNWSAEIPLVLGTNTVTVKSIDTAGNESTPVTRIIVYAIDLQLTIQIVGSGTVTPNLNGELLELGRTYTVTAVPEQNNFFAGWSGGIDSTNPVLTFVMQSNLVLQANFSLIVDPKGTYNGLFYEADAVRHESSGFFTLKIRSRGSFSGKILIEGGKHSFSGKLAANRTAQLPIARRGKNTLNLGFEIDPESKRASGNVMTTDWVAPLLADRAFGDNRTAVAPQAGKFTMIIPRGNDASVSPGGDGYGTLTIRNNGGLRVKGVLADDTRMSQSTTISQDGMWPLYFPLYRGKGSILSWVSFINRPTSNLEGNLNWIKTGAALGKFYPAGFSNEVALVGSRYATPASGRRILNITNAIVSLNDGNLDAPFTTSATLSTRNVLTAASAPTNQLRFRFSLSSGSFSGSFTHPSDNKKSTIRGVVLQRAKEARGFFTGTNQTGGVTIQGN